MAKRQRDIYESSPSADAIEAADELESSPSADAIEVADELALLVLSPEERQRRGYSVVLDSLERMRKIMLEADPARTLTLTITLK